MELGCVLSGPISSLEGFDLDSSNNLVHMLLIDCELNKEVQSLENELQNFIN